MQPIPSPRTICLGCDCSAKGGAAVFFLSAVDNLSTACKLTTVTPGNPQKGFQVHPGIKEFRFRCESCGRWRDGDFIATYKGDFSERYEMAEGTMCRNINYCNDNVKCYQGAAELMQSFLELVKAKD